MGAESLRWSEIESWARMTRRSPEPWEVEVITAIDGRFMSFMAERRKAERPTTPPPTKGIRK